MGSINYSRLYALQDQIFSVMNNTDTSFFLTGGTCLHRFHYGKRYSDDLDFFTNENNLFRDDCRLFSEKLNQSGFKVETIVDSRDFIRIMVNSICKIDLVNDRVYRLGRSEQTENGLRIDNVFNIFSNKLCAVLSRDEPKDVFDICTIFRFEEIDWEEIFTAANKKCVLDKEVLEFRLKSFPTELLGTLAAIDTDFIDSLKSGYLSVVEKIIDAIPF